VFTVAEYVMLERETGIKHEMLAGQVWAMAGGSPEHALYSANVLARLTSSLRGKRCAACSSDLRLGVQATGLLTYADVTVVCGRLRFDPADTTKHTVTNARVIVEVLSPSTEDYDRGDKLGHYKKIASLKEVVFVAYDRREIEVVRRERGGSWSRHVARDGQRVKLTSIECELSVVDVYRDPLKRRARSRS
jgi:Uma2 family endonuclease